MIRVYDTKALWRHDEIIRIRHLEAEIAARQEEIERLIESKGELPPRQQTGDPPGVENCVVGGQIKEKILLVAVVAQNKEG